MPKTPFFPPWRSRLARLGQRTRQIRQATLSQLETVLQGFLPSCAFAPAAQTRQRIFTAKRTAWCFLWQVLDRARSCRAVVREVQAHFAVQQGPQVDENTSAYCQARDRLSAECLKKGMTASADRADRLAHGSGTFLGRPVKVVDGSSVLLADTPLNQADYPQPAGQKPGCGFPIMKLVLLFSLASGAICAVARANKHSSERGLLWSLWPSFKGGDILLADRGFGDYPTLMGALLHDVDVVARLHQSRKVDFRKCQRRLGSRDGLFDWEKGARKPNYLSRAQWREIPDTLRVRIIRFEIVCPGFRVRQITLVTTLLDADKCSAQELAQLFLQRWRMELCLDDLKTTLGMEHLRTKSPDMVEKELYAHLLAHNLVRCLMAQAAEQTGVDLARISFKGSIDALHSFSSAIGKTRQAWRKRKLRDQLLETLAADLVPLRPNRREPRVVKRRPKDFPLMHLPRSTYKQLFRHNRARCTKFL
jgi:hypothetical protein